MVQVRLLAPWSNAKGEPQAAGAVIDVSDEEATALGNRGMISRLDEEKALEEQEKSYSAAITRGDVAPLAPESAPTDPPPAPKATSTDTPKAPKS